MDSVINSNLFHEFATVNSLPVAFGQGTRTNLRLKLILSSSNLDLFISPYFIACLLWYPAYECLFSMIRKKIKKSEITGPDNRHLHQLLFVFFSKKMKLNKWIISSLAGITINTYNLIIFYFALINVSQTKTLVFIIFLNVILYNTIYFVLKKNI